MKSFPLITKHCPPFWQGLWIETGHAAIGIGVGACVGIGVVACVGIGVVACVGIGVGFTVIVAIWQKAPATIMSRITIR